MIRKFKYRHDEMEWRAARALTWCFGDGTEVEENVVDLFRIYDLQGVGHDDDVEKLVGIMERTAREQAREYLRDEYGGWDEESRRHNFLLCMRHLRATGEPHPELIGKLHL
jgi:hypothetical protein